MIGVRSRLPRDLSEQRLDEHGGRRNRLRRHTPHHESVHTAGFVAILAEQADVEGQGVSAGLSAEPCGTPCDRAATPEVH